MWQPSAQKNLFTAENDGGGHSTAGAEKSVHAAWRHAGRSIRKQYAIGDGRWGHRPMRPPHVHARGRRRD